MIVTGTCVTTADRDEWLAERQSGIGASEAAMAIGVSRWGTPLDLYLRKVGQAPPVVETPEMRWGTRLEPQIAEAYSEQTGFGFVAEQQFIRSPTIPWIFATLDRVRSDGRIVELKNVGARAAADWGEPGTDEIPVHYLVQVLHQMIVTGTEVVDVAALIGGSDFRVYTVDRDEDVSSRIVEKEEAFWDRVRRREPPPPDLDRDGRNLTRLWPGCEGMVDFDEARTEQVRLWEVQKRTIADLEKARDRAKAEILLELKEAAFARLADGRILTRKVTRVEEQQVTRKAYEFTDIRIKTPKG